MIPPKHISLLIADGRRAHEWQLGLKKEGLDVQRIETSGSDAAKGDYWLVVPESQRFVAQRFVTDVLAGTRSLPRSAPIRGPLMWGVVLIVVSLVALMIAAGVSG